MAVEPERIGPPVKSKDSRVAQQGKRRFLAAAFALTALPILGKFFKDATAAHAQTNEELSAGSPPPEEFAVATPKLVEDFSNPETSIFPANTQGEGYKSSITDGTLIVEALPGGSGIATVSSKPDTAIPRGTTITALVQTDGGFIIGRGSSADYIRASVFSDGAVRAQTVARQGSSFQTNPLGEGRLPGLTDTPNTLSLRFAEGAVQLGVNGQQVAISIPQDVIDKYDGAGIVFGALGSNRVPAKAIFDNLSVA